DKPSNIRREQQTGNHRARQSHEKHGGHCERREEGDTPVHVISESHLVISEELMMLQGVPIVEFTKRPVLRRPVKPHTMGPI
ncbi:hypothetical protein, partial [Salmonella enterica]|uniref:hypothetical protein n=1 Tax=Salmonella enterica TaxID=28901 RepID=UPI003CF6EA7E